MIEINKQLLDELAEEIHNINKSKGFWEDAGILSKTSLIVSELYELVEAHRKDRWAQRDNFRKHIESFDDIEHFNSKFISFIKDTIEDELADAIIRTLDLNYYLYEEVLMKAPTDEFDWETIEKLDVLNNIEDFHMVIIGLSTIITSGVEFALQPLLVFADMLGMTQDDIIFHIKQKVNYNRNRSKLHGKKY